MFHDKNHDCLFSFSNRKPNPENVILENFGKNDPIFIKSSTQQMSTNTRVKLDLIHAKSTSTKFHILDA